MKFNTKKAVGFCSILFVIAGVVAFVFGVVKLGINNTEKLPLLGDFVGGTAGSFWALASLLLIYLSFMNQQEQIEEQREENIKLNNRLEIQLFENTFYNLLNLHNKILQNIDIGDEKGNDSFIPMLHEFVSEFNNTDEALDNELRIIESVNKLNMRHGLDLSSYFRSLSALIFLISDRDNLKKYNSIILSQLSNPEIILCYFYSKFDTSLLKFVEENNFSDVVLNSEYKRILQS